MIGRNAIHSHRNGRFNADFSHFNIRVCLSAQRTRSDAEDFSDQLGFSYGIYVAYMLCARFGRSTSTQFPFLERTLIKPFFNLSPSNNI